MAISTSARSLSASDTRMIPSPGNAAPASILSFVERVSLTPQVKLDLHLRRYPHSGNSELFLLNGLAGTDRDLPRIVHAVEKYGHFRRPWPELRRPLLDQRRELLRRSSGFSHASGSLIGNVN